MHGNSQPICGQPEHEPDRRPSDVQGQCEQDALAGKSGIADGARHLTRDQDRQEVQSWNDRERTEKARILDINCAGVLDREPGEVDQIGDDKEING